MLGGREAGIVGEKQGKWLPAAGSWSCEGFLCLSKVWVQGGPPRLGGESRACLGGHSVMLPSGEAMVLLDCISFMQERIGDAGRGWQKPGAGRKLARLCQAPGGWVP